MITQWMVRVTCAVALLLVGFAHEAPSFAKGTFVPAEFAEYILPDGTLPVFCIAGKADRMHTHDKAQMHGCDACRISASVLLPIPDNYLNKHLPTATAATQRYDVEFSFPRAFPPNTGPRAPPSAFA